MVDVGTFSRAQKDGSPPAVRLLGAAPGLSGVALVRVRYRGAAHYEAVLRRHVVSFSNPGVLHCRRAGERASHDAPDGAVGIQPAGLDYGLDAERDLDATLVVVDPSRLSLAAAEDTVLEAELVGQLHAFDPGLVALGRRLARECHNGFRDGPVAWNETADRFVAALAARHTTGRHIDRCGLLDLATFRRLRDHIQANLDAPLDVASLAALCGRSQFHFSRVFSRSVGVSPYQYVAHLRLKRAVELVRAGRLPLAEVAAAVGYADQSHLTRWVRRAYGVTPAKLTEP